MSSFFTLPASQKKRKRADQAVRPSAPGRRRTVRDDDSISGSDVSDDDARGALNQSDGDDDDEDDDDEEEFPDEDPAAKRVRLAEQYLANTQREVLEDVGFDAADVDREILRSRMGERLVQDTAESKGKLYRWMADGLDWQQARTSWLRHRLVRKSYTGVAVQGRYVFAVSKDLHLVKWELPERQSEEHSGSRARSSPRVVAATRGDRKSKKGEHHDKAILCIAASQDGKFVATGGLDKKLIVWDAATLRPLKVFYQHRDSVTALAFRRGTNQLFSASKDRTVKIWSLDELAYIETLFGHQDEVLDVDALAHEQCVTVGARDRTARLWKVVEESQLVFRGGGAPSRHKALAALKAAYQGDSTLDVDEDISYHEGSIDRIAIVDDDTFITAADNGSMSLWDIRKKKPVFTLPLAHGLDPALPLEEASADIEPDETIDEKARGGKQPRWITALKVIPFSDTIISGSWDGHVRVWKISQDKRRIEPLGAITSAPLNGNHSAAESNGATSPSQIGGVINDLAIIDRGERGKDGVLVAAAVGREHRLGRWKDVREGARRDGIVLFEVPRTVVEAGDDGENGEGSDETVGADEGDDAFAGFD